MSGLIRSRLLFSLSSPSCPRSSFYPSLSSLSPEYSFRGDRDQERDGDRERNTNTMRDKHQRREIKGIGRSFSSSSPSSSSSSSFPLSSFSLHKSKGRNENRRHFTISGLPRGIDREIERALERDANRDACAHTHMESTNLSKDSSPSPSSISSASFSDLPGAVHASHKLAVIYTCKKCNTRSGKMIGKQAYDHGVVLVRCPGCNNLHLIADRLQFFTDESWDIEGGLERYGESVQAVNRDNILELTPKDILGEEIER